MDNPYPPDGDDVIITDIILSQSSTENAELHSIYSCFCAQTDIQ